MTLIYLYFWLVLGCDLRGMDILLFVYVDVLILAFIGFVRYEIQKEKEEDGKHDT